MGGTLCATLFLFWVIGCGQEEHSIDHKGEPEKIVSQDKPITYTRTNSPPKKVIELTLSNSLLRRLLDSAIDTENSQSIKFFVEKYRNDPDPRKRIEFIDNLIGLGQDGLPYLASFIKDPDSFVAEYASTIFESQIDLIEEPTLKASILGQAIMNTDNEDSLCVLSAKLETIPPDVAVRQIVIVCRAEASHPKAVETVKKAYEIITGEPFTTIAEANRWARMHR